MGIKKVQANTPGRRHATFDDFADITVKKPQKSLIKIRTRTGGRNSQGKITVRHRGGGAKRYIRLIDFKRDKFDIPAKVASIEYDPNRGARIALLNYVDGEKRYIIAPIDLKVADQVISSKKPVDIKVGNATALEFIPAGVAIFNLEMIPGQGAKIARGAGNVAYVMGVEDKYAQIKMPSGEIRKIRKECLCTIGQASNPEKKNISLGKAGRKRHLGWRPTVRGTAMNPTDHPHGGGEGKQPIGLRHPKTKWGKNAYGVKTRRKSISDKLIVKRRTKKRRKK